MMGAFWPAPSGLPDLFAFRPELQEMERAKIPHTAWRSRMRNQ